MRGTRSRPATGILFGTTAYLLWGVFPAFFKLLGNLAPVEFVAYRCAWSLAWLALLLTVIGRWGEVYRCLRSARSLWPLVTSAALIGTNWGLFLYAVTSGQVLQSSLAYFINPLLSVLLGMVFLRERLRVLQGAGVAIAAGGVLTLTFATGHFPWLALSMAVTFALYGLTRKTAPADGAVGLSVEMILMAPAAALYLILLTAGGFGTAVEPTADTWRVQTILVFAGPVTISPLLLFIAAARRLPLATVGMLQYITPTLHFVLAVVAFKEPFSETQLISFVFIWIAVALYLYDNYRKAGLPAAAPGEARCSIEP